MGKLGFATIIANNSVSKTKVYSTEASFSGWEHRVPNINNYTSMFNGLTEKGVCVTCMSFLTNGCMLGVMRATNERSGNYVSAWLFLPCKLKVDGEEVLEILTQMKVWVLSSNIAEYDEDINDYFEQSFLELAAPPRYMQSCGGQYGIRREGENSIVDILGGGRYQSYYPKYKEIFLLDDNDEISINENELSRFKDLTNEPLETLITLLPPTQESLDALGEDVIICFKNGKPFDCPLLLKRGEKATLQIRKQGLDATIIAVTPKIDNMPLNISHLSLTWKKTVKPTSFDIKLANGKSINNAQIMVNGELVTNKGILLSEEASENVQVEIKATGCEPFAKAMNLKLAVVTSVILEKSDYMQTFDVEIDGEDKAELNVIMKNERPLLDGVSPLKGYTAKGRVLIYNAYSKRILMMSVVIAIIITCMVWIIAGTVCSWWSGNSAENNKHNIELLGESSDSICATPATTIEDTTTNQTQTAPATTQEPVAAPIDQNKTFTPQEINVAVAYLESHNTWNRDEMEKIPALQGLFDAMNTYNMTAIADGGVYAERLSKSKVMKTISEHAKLHIEKELNPKVGEHNPTFVTADKKDIKHLSYLYWIDDNCRKEK